MTKQFVIVKKEPFWPGVFIAWFASLLFIMGFFISNNFCSVKNSFWCFILFMLLGLSGIGFFFAFIYFLIEESCFEDKEIIVKAKELRKK